MDQSIPNQQKRSFPINLSSNILRYSLILFFIYLGDSLMQYATPNFLDKNLGNTTLTGLLLSLASLMGIISGIIIGEYFKNKTYYFFIKFLLITSLMFPLILIFFNPAPIILIVAMSFWGIYPEINQFANSKFVDSKLKAEKRSSGWSMLLTFKYLSYTIGPLMAGLIIDKGEHLVFIFSAFFILLAILGYIVYFRTTKTNHHYIIEIEREDKVTYKKNSILHEIKTWRVLMKTLWHLALFLFTVTFIDAAFWTIGPIISESLKKQGVPGELLLFFYMVPSVIVTPFVGKLSQRYSKKKVMFITSIISCLFLAFSGIINNVYLFLLFILIYSFISSLISPLINAVFSDYIGRLKESATNLISLESIIMDLSYICAPVTIGFLSDHTSPQQTFFFMGLGGLLVSLLMIIIVPKKIHMPQILLSKLNH